MRAPHRATGGLSKNRVQCHGDAERIEAFNDPRRSSHAHFAQSRKSVLELNQLREMQTEEMRFMISLDCAQLDAGNEPNAYFARCVSRFGDAGDGVVVRQRERGQPSALGRSRDIRRSARAIRGRRMRVEIDKLEIRSSDGGRHEV